MTENADFVNRKLLDKVLDKQVSNNKEGNVKIIDKHMMPLKPDMMKSINKKEVNLKVVQSYQQIDWYHFKVMELTTFEDTRKNSSCRVRFHFMFDLLKKKERSELKGYEWDMGNAPRQNLILSQDTRKLMEIFNDYTAIVYTRSNIDEDGKAVPDTENGVDMGQQVVWQVAYHIKNLPKNFSQ